MARHRLAGGPGRTGGERGSAADGNSCQGRRDDDAVASAPLGLVQRGVGVGDQLKVPTMASVALATPTDAVTLAMVSGT